MRLIIIFVLCDYFKYKKQIYMKTHSSFIECSWPVTFNTIALKEDPLQIEDDIGGFRRLQRENHYFKMIYNMNDDFGPWITEERQIRSFSLVKPQPSAKLNQVYTQRSLLPDLRSNIISMHAITLEDKQKIKRERNLSPPQSQIVVLDQNTLN
ncbi:hypothetical protein pb186bvf_020324 [Paramecium bursaria]